jgi:hypothetical protein
MDARFPRALDLEANVLVALAGPLRGVASSLAGTHCPEHWREMLRGERSMPAGDLYRLATEPSREAREAVRAALAILTAAVEERGPAQGTLAGQAVATATAATGLLGMLTKALEDGHVDDDERAELRRAAVPLARSLAAVEAFLLPEARR